MKMGINIVKKADPENGKINSNLTRQLSQLNTVAK